MKIALAADHGGLELKEMIKEHLKQKGLQIEDFGTYDQASVDYPDYAKPAALAVAQGKADFGILVCGTGIGMSIAANKQAGVRAALVHDLFSAQATREHNDSNVLCLGARIIGSSLALSIVDTWLATEFSGGRHLPRVEKLENLPQEEAAKLDPAALKQEAEDVVLEIVEKGKLQPGQLLVVGCSTSEIRGKRIGSDSSAETAAYVYEGLVGAAQKAGILLAFQGCEHINRSLVVPLQFAEKYDLTQVNVIPVAEAGGAMSAHAYKNYPDSIVVSDLDGRAHAGLDIGNTFIAMHLRKVAVPLRLNHNSIGEAAVQAAYTRLPLVGGQRAVYSLAQEPNRS